MKLDTHVNILFIPTYRFIFFTCKAVDFNFVKLMYVIKIFIQSVFNNLQTIFLQIKVNSILFLN